MIQSISTFGYGVAALSFLLLTFLLAKSWQGKKEGALLLACSLSSTLWATSGASLYVGELAETIFITIAEYLRVITWLAFLLVITAKFNDKHSVHNFIKFVSFTTVILAIVLFFILSIMIFYNGELPRIFSFDLRLILFLMLSIIGLVLVEHLYRNASQKEKWSIKFFCFGLGGIFVFDFFLFSDALLLNYIDQEVWSARGYVNSMVVPLIAVAVARNPRWSLDVFVSRKFVFHSVTILAAGVYLVMMAAGGYYIKHFGGYWGSILQVAFLFGAVIFLFSLLSSGQLRANLRVFLSKHFFNYKYDYREEWLQLTGSLSNAWLDADLYKTIISSISRIVESPGGILWLRNPVGEYEPSAAVRMSSSVDFDHRDNDSIVSFLGQKEWVIDIEEYSSHPDKYGELILPKWLRNLDQAWLVTPLLANAELIQSTNNVKSKDGASSTGLLGFIVMARPLAKVKINWEVRDLLLTSGRQCASYLALFLANSALVDARQFEAFNRLSAYVVHDLKNIAAQLSLIVSNYERHKNNPEFFLDVISTVNNATQKMNRMLDQLRKDRGNLTESESIVDINKTIKFVIEEHANVLPVPEYTQISKSILIRANKDRFSAILAHLIQNAQEATPNDGQINITVQEEQNMVCIEISDTGCGMDSDFLRDSLFRPFVTTKGNAGMGIGAYEAREFITSLGGKLSVSSVTGQGTTFTIKIQKIEETSEVSDPQHIIINTG